MRYAYLIITLIAIGGLVYMLSGNSDPNSAELPEMAAPGMVEITLPATLSENASLGKTAFEAKCAARHGNNAIGQAGVAPPLVHKIYEPSHHGDEAFQRAVSIGVRQHHWPFGNMAPGDGLTRADVSMIVAYIRELQRENGIN